MWSLLLTVLSKSSASSRSVIHSTVFEASATGPYPCVRIPSALTLGTSNIIAAFAECRRWAGDQCFVDGTSNASKSEESNRSICLRRSFDGGATWGALQLNITQRYSANPSAVYDPTMNTTRLFFDDTVSGLLYSVVSADNGASWHTATPLLLRTSAAEPHPKPIAAHAGPGNSAVRMSSGVLLVAAYHANRSWTSMFSYASVYRSDDAGVSWTDCSPLQQQHQQAQRMFPFLGEPSLALVRVRSNGWDEVLVLNSRCPTGRAPWYPGPAAPCDCDCRGVTLSTDGGTTWGAMNYDAALRDPDCQGAVIALKNGSLAFSNANSATRRQDLAVRLGSVRVHHGGAQRSGGAHATTAAVVWAKAAWPLGKRNTSAGYSSMLELGGTGRIGVLWETEGNVEGCRGEGCSIVFSVSTA